MSELDTLAERTRHRWPALTRAERRVAQAFLAHYPLAGLETVQALAARAGVSTATVLRFVGKLGFSNYAEFQSLLRQQLAESLQSPLTRYHRTQALEPGSPAELVAAALDERADQLRRAKELLFPDAVERAVELLADPARRVLLLGGRYSGSIARYCAGLLRGLRPKVDVVAGQTQTWADALLDVDRRTTLLVFDFRRYQRDVVTFARLARERGARVVLITDPWHSDIARFADTLLAVPVAARSLHDSLTAAVALCEALVAAVARTLGGHTRARLCEQERLRRPFQPALSGPQAEGEPMSEEQG